MFQKKDIIYSETLGVCQVADITKLTQNRGNTYMYYVLRSVFDKDKVSYIPVENHKVVLRELIDKEEAQLKKQTMYEKADENEKREIDYVLMNEKKQKVNNGQV